VERWRLNNAVLRLPARSPMLADMLAMMMSKPIIAPWWSWRRKLRQRARAAFGIDFSLARLPWGTTGPRLINHFAAQHCITHLAKATPVFYPLPHYEAEAIFGPSSIVASYCTEDTVAVHLWHSAIKARVSDRPPPGSWIEAQCKRLGVGRFHCTPQLEALAM
jgi:hypothetical protein